MAGATAVEALDVATYTAPTGAPAADGTLAWDATTMLLVEARCDDTVPVYGSGGFTTYDCGRMRDQLTGRPEAGIPPAEIKIGESWANAVHRDLARMAQERGRLGRRSSCSSCYRTDET